MTNLREAAQMALKALDKLNKDGWILADFEDEVCASIEALRAALAQPEQEPVAHLWECLGRWSAMIAHDGEHADLSPPSWLCDAIKAATATPQREVYCGCGDEIVDGDGAVCGTCVAVKYKEKEWVGLTLEEMHELEKEFLGWQVDQVGMLLIHAAQDKLKEKNHQSALHNMNKAAEKNGEEL